MCEKSGGGGRDYVREGLVVEDRSWDGFNEDLSHT